jgi:hypothetical protein
MFRLSLGLTLRLLKVTLMITKEMLLERTGYDSFLQFKRNCQRSAKANSTGGLTKYFFDKNKT